MIDTPADIEPLVYTVPQAARAIGVSQCQMRTMIADGTIRTLPGVGRRILISRNWLRRWVETAHDPATSTRSRHHDPRVVSAPPVEPKKAGLPGASPTTTNR